MKSWSRDDVGLGQVWQDEAGRLWRVIAIADAPTVTLAEVEQPLHQRLLPPRRVNHVIGSPNFARYSRLDPVSPMDPAMTIRVTVGDEPFGACGVRHVRSERYCVLPMGHGSERRHSSGDGPCDWSWTDSGGSMNDPDACFPDARANMSGSTDRADRALNQVRDGSVWRYEGVEYRVDRAYVASDVGWVTLVPMIAGCESSGSAVCAPAAAPRQVPVMLLVELGTEVSAS